MKGTAMKYQSIIENRGSTSFPEYRGERVYMREFYKATGLPVDLLRWKPTVDALLDGVETDEPIYIMIDEALVKAGNTHRRNGLHVDGYWNPGISAHGGSGGGMPSGHNSIPSDYGRHGSIRPSGHNAAPSSGRHGHSPAPGRHAAGPAACWQEAEFSAKEAIILSSSISAARGLVGEFEGIIGDGGDCSGIDVSGLTVIPMVANTIYAGNVTALHESLPVAEDCYRQLVRLNVPGWHPA